MKCLEELYAIFHDYIEFYSDEEYEAGATGWKIKADSPPEVVAAFKEYKEILEEAAREGLKL